MNSEFQHQASEGGLHESQPAGWSQPKPEVLPRPTYWPVTLALGITFLFWGLVASPAITIIGLALSGIALAGWIGELLRER
ncbi:MAG: hypothetical protein ACK2TX_13060 [Anaerolineales bacterium]